MINARPGGPDPRVDAAASDTTVRVEVVTTQSEMDALAPQWDALLAASRNNNVFLTWDWISTWWGTYGTPGDLQVLVVRSGDGQIVGLAPLRRRRRALFGRSTTTFIGTGSDVTPEYLDFILKPGLEAAALAAIVRHLLEDSTIAEVDLQPVASESANVAQLSAMLSSGGGILRRLPGSVCPFLALPPTIEEFRHSRSRNYRKKIGEYERKCDRELQATLRQSKTEIEVSEDLDALRRLHVSRWDRRSRAFRTHAYVEFHERFARRALERGWLRLFSLESGSRRVAMLYCLFYGGRYYFYQSGRDPDFSRQRVGLVLMHKVIQEAIRERAEVFDFLSGDEAYKYRWATDRTTGTRILYWKSVGSWAMSVCRQQLATVASVPDRLIALRSEFW